LNFATFDEICEELEGIAGEIDKLIITFHDGKILQEGISLCLIGCPNVGKSSLMNALLDTDRAIVSPIQALPRYARRKHETQWITYSPFRYRRHSRIWRNDRTRRHSNEQS